MDIEKLFTYVPPNEASAEKYAKLHASFEAAESHVEEIWDNETDDQTKFPLITGVLQALAQDIKDTCPLSADTVAAVRCVRLARMAANEFVIEPSFDLATLFSNELLKARWQACAAIALDQED